MGIEIISYLFRFAILIGLQVLVLNHINLFDFINPYLYVMFILTLPMEISGGLLLLVAFVTGISIDVFMNTLGMHASACVTMAFVRPYLLKLIAPRDGYEFGARATVQDLGLTWFVTYAGILILIHHLVLFYLEYFKFSEFFRTFGRATAVAAFSLVFVIIVQYLTFSQRRLE